VIVGLGNPGAKYEETRHNLGFCVVSSLSEKHRVLLTSKGYRAWWGKGYIFNQPVILAKPMTFMNLSGKAVKALLQGLKQSTDKLLIIHDDVDLALGRVKVKYRGGDAGHKGIRSILEELGTDEFTRIRMGIGRPSAGQETTDYVLCPFEPSEKELVSREVAEAVILVENLLNQG
jgi:peptidyl-tRNA hydrolase, PTH1 family